MAPEEREAEVQRLRAEVSRLQEELREMVRVKGNLIDQLNRCRAENAALHAGQKRRPVGW